MSKPSGHDWHRFRPYLRVLAEAGFDDRLRAKLDPSDVVQQTLVNAVEKADSFRGESEAEMRAWLRAILVNNLAAAARDHGRKKRDVNRERSIRAEVEDSAIRGESILMANDPSPAETVQSGERVLALYTAVAALTPDQREAIRLHYWSGLNIDEIAARMDRSAAAVGGLLKRGLKSLRSELRADE